MRGWTLNSMTTLDLEPTAAMILRTLENHELKVIMAT